jgi:hypothetical protein
MGHQPLQESSSTGSNYAQINKALAQLNNEQQVKVFRTPDGNVTIGKIADSEYGLSFSDGEITFLKITKEGMVINDGTTTFLTLNKDGLLVNDGTNDRILIGKDEGGF